MPELSVLTFYLRPPHKATFPGPVSRGIHPFLEAKIKISYKNNHHHGSSNRSIVIHVLVD